MRNQTGTGSPSPMFMSKWLTVFVVELVLTSILNGFTILTFARTHHLRKPTTYLIINLTIADLFVGTVFGPIHIYQIMTLKRGSGFGWRKFNVMILDNVFMACSLVNLALLSLERLHATLCPFRHCLLLDWVYFKAVTVVCILILSCHPGIRRRYVFSDCTTGQQIRLGFAPNSCAFHRHCRLRDNSSECKTKSPSILI